MKIRGPVIKNIPDRQKCRVPSIRAPLKLGDFGSRIESIRDGVLKLTLDYHSFAVVELE